MAPLNVNARQIMEQSRVERQALFGPVSEISRRLQPRHLVDVATHYAKCKVATVFGGVSDAVKDNGGTAAAAALGAIAVFDAGRKSVVGRATSANATEPSGMGRLTGAEDPDGVPVPHVDHAQQNVTNLARAKVLGSAAGGLLLGHVVGRTFQPTAKEHELFGKVSGEIQEAASEFVSQHSLGAKLAAAQAFGFARYSAAFLAIMAAVSNYMLRPGDGDNPPG